jgi:hypothetical protein
MLHPQFWSDRRFSFGTVAIGAAYFAFFGMYFVFTQYLQLVRDYSPLAAGLWALPVGLSQLIVANLSRPMVARYTFLSWWRAVGEHDRPSRLDDLYRILESMGLRDRSRSRRRWNRALHAASYRGHHVLVAAGQSRRRLRGQ